MKTRLIVLDIAEAQLRAIALWVDAHAPRRRDTVLSEVEDAFRLLIEVPEFGAPFTRAAVPGVRRVVLRRSQHSLYYVYDPVHRVVYVLAFWANARRQPRLQRPPRLRHR